MSAIADALADLIDRRDSLDEAIEALRSVARLRPASVTARVLAQLAGSSTPRPAGKRRGRPPGSKNKPKVAASEPRRPSEPATPPTAAAAAPAEPSPGRTMLDMLRERNDAANLASGIQEG